MSGCNLVRAFNRFSLGRIAELFSAQEYGSRPIQGMGKSPVFCKSVSGIDERLGAKRDLPLGFILESGKKGGDKVARARPVKGSKVSLLVNHEGLPVAVNLSAGNIGDLNACQSLLGSLPAGRPGI